MIEVLIFGAGEGGREAMHMVNKDNVRILAYIDNDEKKVGQEINGIEIVPPEKISEYNYDYILLASMYFNEIFDQLIDMGIDESKIIGIDASQAAIENMYHSYHLKKEKYKRIFKEEELYNAIDNYFICDMNKFQRGRNCKFYNYPDYILKGIDYVRLSTVELAAREIIERKITGAVGELGVYRGDFSSFLSNIFPERNLYLFDTFEGFHQKDVDIEKQQGFSKSKVRHLKDTNIDLVIKKLSHTENYHIVKGYFPESAIGLEDVNFAFVSIDVDLYKPTYAGLQFFYKRLSKGGYIFVHDYNFPRYRGVKEAVRKFCDEKSINYVPISDYFGSIIIKK